MPLRDLGDFAALREEGSGVFNFLVNRDCSDVARTMRHHKKREMKTFVFCGHASAHKRKYLLRGALKGGRRKNSCGRLRPPAVTPGKAVKTFLGIRLREGTLQLQRRMGAKPYELFVNKKFNVSGFGVCRRAKRRRRESQTRVAADIGQIPLSRPLLKGE